jgi:hypothetical protein
MNMPEDNLEQRINQQIGAFDLISLLRLLKHKGYQEKFMRFDSYSSQTSQERLIREVKIYTDHVLIVVDLGLLGIQTPLPSVMIREIKPDIGQGTFSDKLLDMLDHTLILNYISNIYPEINNEFFPNWKNTQRQILLLQNMHSASTLFWTFQQVFPEFSLTLDNKDIEQQINALPIILNQSNLGDGSHFGGVVGTETPCIRINLYLEKEHYRNHVLWVDEVENRLQTYIYPLIDKREIYLIVSLRLPHRQKVFQLSNQTVLGREIMCDESNEDSLLNEVYYPALHQGAVNLPMPEADYTIQWGEPCRIHI